MDNVSFFDGANRFVVDRPIRLIELFAGIGSQAKALERIIRGGQFEHYRICEFDKYAVASYNAVHGTNFTTSDITKITADDLGIVDTDKYCYIMTYSFPCQDLSLAGKKRGMGKGTGTRSGLLWEVERLLDECKELPQVLIMENVPQVIGTKNIEHFAKWQEKLESLGYKNKWQVLNAKDFGVPQNRERCFMVSVLGDYYYEFPKKIKLEKRLKDVLETEVAEKYYLSDRAIQGIMNTNFDCNKLEHRTQKNGIMPTICARDYKDPKLVIELNELTSGQSQANRIYDPNGLSVTLSANGGGLGAKTGLYLVDNEPVALDEQNNYIRKDGCIGTLTTDGSSPKHNNRLIENCRVRKLTPKECWRLMGFDDADVDRAKSIGLSDAQLYKQAGNSIVVNVLEAIMKNLLKNA